MRFKCPSCGSAMKYDAVIQKMRCDYCNTVCYPEDLDEYEQALEDARDEKERKQKEAEMQDLLSENNLMDEETMDCNIYTCGDCGAELVINGNETATFCAYCGQPTIVFSRVSKELRPKYIIPFSVSKEQAIQKVRDRLSSSKYIPDEIKEFHIDKARGIYIPYWLCDVAYEDTQLLRGTVRSAGGYKKQSSTQSYYYFRKGRGLLEKVTLDASKQLNDESSQRLEPYNMQSLVPFKPEYLAGYYADKYDVNRSISERVALERAKLMFDEEVRKSVLAENVETVKCKPRCKIDKTEYALLPAWFITFQYEDESYTILINGQTGKMVGAFPYKKGKVHAMITVITCLIGAPIAFLAYPYVLMVEAMGSLPMQALFWIVMILFGYGIHNGFKRFSKIREGIELTTSKSILSYVKERNKI